MSLEATTLEQQAGGPAKAEDRRASTERRGTERRKTESRINNAAPRRSLLRSVGLSAFAMSTVPASIILVAGEMLTGDTLWLPLAASLAVMGFAILAFMVGCIEQRLIEIRLELMMSNEDSRKANRRQGDRRT